MRPEMRPEMASKPEYSLFVGKGEDCLKAIEETVDAVTRGHLLDILIECMGVDKYLEGHSVAEKIWMGYRHGMRAAFTLVAAGEVRLKLTTIPKEPGDEGDMDNQINPDP